MLSPCLLYFSRNNTAVRAGTRHAASAVIQVIRLKRRILNTDITINLPLHKTHCVAQRQVYLLLLCADLSPRPEAAPAPGVLFPLGSIEYIFFQVYTRKSAHLRWLAVRDENLRPAR